MITPALWTSIPLAVSPCVTRSAIHALDWRVSCPITTRPGSARTFQIVAQRAADHVGAVLGQGKFAGDAANPIGAEELSRLGCHAELKDALAAAGSGGTFSMITVTRTGLGFITCTRGSET